MGAVGHIFDRSILREYDIRGIVGETLFEADAIAIGLVFGSRIRRAGGSRVCVGVDGRLSGPAFVKALTSGLLATGCTVLDIGRGPTPMLYFATRLCAADGGIMVTGSHNPAHHNGFKMVFFGKPFFGLDITNMAGDAARADYHLGQGSHVQAPIMDQYVQRLLHDHVDGRPLRVVWDCGNGVAGDVVSGLVARLPGEHTVLFGDVDGNFPNHHPDPTEPHNLEALIARVRQERADLGIAFDGDGDRIGVVDSEGEIVWGDQLLTLFAEQVLTERPGASIIADVKASKVFFQRIEHLGGKALMGRTGHSLIKTMMAEHDAPLAGEMSGHIFFADRYYGFDDAAYAAIRLISLVSGWQNQSLADWRRKLPRMVNTPEIRIPCADDRKFAVIEEVRARLSAAGCVFVAIDGVRVDSGDGWWLLRASNTQAALVARCESATETGLSRLIDVVWEQLEAAGVQRSSAT